MKNFLSKLSSLGLIFLSIHAILVLLIPLWIKLFPPSHSCGIFPCIFSDEQGFFLLFNMPGLFGGYFVIPMIQWLKSEEVRHSGEFTIIDYIPIYLISAIFYYFVGVILQMIFSNAIYRLKIKKLKKG